VPKWILLNLFSEPSN